MRIWSAVKATTTSALMVGFLASCGSSNLADEAEGVADDNCACTTFDCTREGTKWFNKMAIVDEDKVDALSAADLERYRAASSRSSDCQDALRE